MSCSPGAASTRGSAECQSRELPGCCPQRGRSEGVLSPPSNESAGHPTSASSPNPARPPGTPSRGWSQGLGVCCLSAVGEVCRGGRGRKDQSWGQGLLLPQVLHRTEALAMQEGSRPGPHTRATQRVCMGRPAACPWASEWPRALSHWPSDPPASSVTGDIVTCPFGQPAGPANLCQNHHTALGCGAKKVRD